MQTRPKRVTARDLYRIVSNFNTKHNVDRPDAGFIEVERHYAGHRKMFRCYVRSGVGDIYVTRFGSPADVISELKAKDWRRVLMVARADNDNAPHNRQFPG